MEDAVDCARHYQRPYQEKAQYHPDIPLDGVETESAFNQISHGGNDGLERNRRRLLSCVPDKAPAKPENAGGSFTQSDSCPRPGTDRFLSGLLLKNHRP